MANNSLVKKGKCLNIGECQNANEKKVLEIDTLEPFICPQCKTELIPVKTGGGGINWGLIAGAIVLLLAIGGGAFWFITKDKALEPGTENVVGLKPDSQGKTDSQPKGGDENNQQGDGDDENSSGQEQTGKPTDDKPYVEINEKIQGEDPLLTGKGTISYSYGKYNGDIKDGKAHGSGVRQYFKCTLISDKDSKKRYAEEGDYVVGTFRNDKIVFVEWFGKDKVLKEVIQIGSSGVED